MRWIYDTTTVWKRDMTVWIKEPIFGIIRALVFPLVWMIIFANAFGGSFSNLPIAVVNYDNGPGSTEFLGAVFEDATLVLKYQPSYAEAIELFKSKKVYAVIVIPAGMEKVEVILDNSMPTVAQAIESKIVQAAAATQAESDKTQSQMASVESTTITVESDIKYGRGAKYLDFLAPAIIIQTIAFASIFSGGLSLLLEKQLGILKTLLVAPVSKSAIVLGKTLSGVTQCLVSGVAALLIALGMGVQFNAGLLGLVLMFLVMALTAFCFIGLCVFFTTFIKNLQGFMLVMIMTIMPLWIISGSLYPREAMAWWLKPLSVINPLTYAVEAQRNIMVRYLHVGSVAIDLLILAGFSAAMFGLGVLAFKRTVE